MEILEGGTDQPVIAPESKPERKERSELESEVRSQKRVASLNAVLENRK